MFALTAGLSTSACPAARAQCDLGGQQLPAYSVRRFMEEPKSLIKAEIISPRDAEELSLKTGKLALGGAQPLQAILQLMPKASEKQKAAFAVGLHKVVSTCRHSDPVSAARVTRSAALISDRVFRRAYLELDDTGGSAKNAGSAGVQAVNGTLPAARTAVPAAPLPVTPGEADTINDPFAPMPLTDPFAPP